MSLRTLVRDNVAAELATFQASNPDLQAVYSARPESFPVWPCAYVGQIRLQHVHDGVRQTSGEADIVLVGTPMTNASNADTLDTLADALVEWLSDRPHILGSNTVAEPVRSTSASLTVGDAGYDAVIVTLGRIVIQEGRD